MGKLKLLWLAFGPLNAHDGLYVEDREVQKGLRKWRGVE